MEDKYRFLGRSLFALWLLAFFALARPAQAQAVLNPNGSVTGTLDATHTSFTYSYTVTQDGDVTFALTADANLSAIVRFYDSDGTSQLYSFGALYGGTNAVTVPHLAPGATYYVAVTLGGGYGGYTLSNVNAAQTVVNDKEVNDTPAQAVHLPGPVGFTGHLGYSRTSYNDVDGADWYAVTVPQNGDVTFALTAGANLSAIVRFYDVDGASQLYSFGAYYGGTNALTVPHLAPGATYYVAVTLSGGYGGYSVSTSLAPVVNAINPVPGTSKATAVPFAPDSSVTGNLGYSQSSYNTVSSVAWYSFVAPRDSDVTFTLATDAALPLSASVRFYDSDGTSQLYSFSARYGGTNALTVPHLAPGATYYVEVTLDGGYGGYTLSNTVAPLFVAKDVEPNDTSAQAVALNNLSNITGHLGYSRTSYSDIDTQDWYKIALPAGPFQVNIVLSSSLRGYFSLYAPDGSTQLTNNGLIGNGGTAAISYNVLTAGTYYLLVSQYYDGYGAYDINQPVTATVYGTVTLDSIAQFAPSQTVNVEFRTPGTTTALFTRQISVGYNGAYFISNVPRGKYTLAFKGAKWLRKDVPGIDVTVGDANGVNPFLSAGDSNNDNSVDSTDFGILIGAFGSESDIPNSGYDITADFNCDGFVDSTDFGLLIGNFNEMGDK